MIEFTENQIKVLFVDDQPDLLEQAEIFLKKEDERLKVGKATSVKKALEILEKEDYDAIVSDYQMPQTNGIEFLEIIREKDLEIPFIIFTGRGREDVAMEALNLGANRYLQKGKDPRSQYGVLADAIKQEVKNWRSKRRYEELFEKSPELIAQINEEGKIITANPAMSESLGLPIEELVGKTLHDIMPKEVAEKRLENGRKAIKKDETLYSEDQREGKYFHNIFSPIRTPGEKDTFQVFSRNITERKLAEEELRKSEEKYRETIQNANIGVVVYGEEKEVKVLNQKMREITGYNRKELPTLKVWFEKLYPDPEKREKIKNRWFQLMSENGQVVDGEAVITRKDGESRNLLFNGVQLKSGNAIAFAQDISERKRTEEKFQQLFESSPDGALLMDKNGVFQEVSDTFCQKIGYDREEIVGTSLAEPIDFMPEESRKETLEKMIERINKEKEITPYTIEAERKDGKTLFVEINAKPLISRGELLGEIVIARDITERKKVEERQNFLHTLLRHDLRNKNTTVEGYLDLLQDTPLTEEQEKYIAKALKANKYSSKLIENVRTLEKIDQEKETGKVSLKKTLLEVIEEQKDSAENEGIEINYKLKECKVKGGPLLGELFSNLIDNSIKHSGCKKIKITNEVVDDGCKVTVEDSGCGIPSEKRQKLFERGFKKKSSSGAGLGTYLIKKIVENYGGIIELEESELGGAKFAVWLEKYE